MLTNERKTGISTWSPSTPRLQQTPTWSRHALLDGGWWPRSTDPAAELPGLIVALDDPRGPVTRLMLSAAGWGSRPSRLTVAGRVVRLGWFASMPSGLLTAIRRSGDRVDLLVVPPETEATSAAAAMAIAADADNTLHAPDILTGVIDRRAANTATPGDSAEGGPAWACPTSPAGLADL